MGKPLGRLCTAKNEKEKKKEKIRIIKFHSNISFLFFDSFCIFPFVRTDGRVGCAMRAGILSRKSLALHSLHLREEINEQVIHCCV
jgi:hypothetical protein